LINIVAVDTLFNRKGYLKQRIRKKFELCEVYGRIICMEQISLADLEPGKVIKKYFYIPENFIVFSKYLVPTENDINRAKRFNFKTFSYWADDNPCAEIKDQRGLADFKEKDDFLGIEISGEKGQEIAQTSREKGLDKELERGGEAISVEEPSQKVGIHKPEAKYLLPNKDITIYGNIVALLHREFSLISGGAKIDISRILKIASVIINYVNNVKEEALLHVSRSRAKYRLEVHSVNTGILSALLSIYLNIKSRDLLNIVSGAIMHDVGILLLPDEKDSETIRKHTLSGFHYLKSIKNTDPILVMPSLQHHERAHGDGYPNKLSLDSIERSSRIISICDSFDNQISFIKYGNDISIHFTKDEFLTWKKEDFDPQLFMAFISVVTSVFKRDSIVLMNSGELAVIKKSNIRFPLNPYVQIITDKNGHKISEQTVIDLIRTKDIWINKFIKKL